jgi:23S rRNA (adenine2503-C2)-methyltransferase
MIRMVCQEKIKAPPNRRRPERIHTMNRTDITALSPEDLTAWLADRHIAPFRAGQILRWIYGRQVDEFVAMTDLKKEIRSMLADHFTIPRLAVERVAESADGSRKYLFRLADGQTIETVLIPEKDHHTLCVSTQVGCAQGCGFCMTAAGGFQRNLTAGEIIAQIRDIRRDLGEAPDKRLSNIVFMGMGEPLANYDAVLRATHNLTHDDALNFSHRRVTLSTSGLAPAMERLGRDASVNLAVSLNAADDETRAFLMPINRSYPLERLMAACRAFPLPNRRMITFEYILIRDVNDRSGDARNLVRLLRGLRAKVNLIPLNAHPCLGLSPSLPERIQAFQEILVQNQYTAIVRKSKGQDISAACGQLSGESTG